MGPLIVLICRLGACAGSVGVRCAAVICFAAILSGVGCGAPTNVVHAPAQGPAPNVPLEVVQAPVLASTEKAEIGLANADKVKQLIESAKGKVVVINLWATYCIPCIEEMPELGQFYKGRDPRRVEFLSFSADAEFTIEDAVKPFVSEKNLPFPVYVLEELPPDELSKAMGVGSSGWDGELPATFVLDSTGALKKHWLERVHLKDLTAAVAELRP